VAPVVARLQSGEEIGHALSALTGIPCDTRVLRRTRSTPQQTRLSAGQRRRNLRGAFEMAPHHYRHVALLDDVVTTGATAVSSPGCSMSTASPR
jgi:predicted amidophosphoribosyltransferase